MSLSVSILVPDGSASELLTLFQQLALLWKFELHELNVNSIVGQSHVDRPLVIDLGISDPAYQEAAARYISECPSHCMLFATQTVFFQPAITELTGVTGVSWQAYDRDMTVNKQEDDAILDGTSGPISLFKYNGCATGDIQVANAKVILRSENGLNLLSRFGKCYIISLPVWQFGIVSFPVWYKIIENALFFTRGLPHLAPGPYVAFRIDDVPVTGESYLRLGYSERKACREIREIQLAHVLYGARIEYMLSSHIINTKGELKAAAEVAPRAFRMLRELHSKGEINIGVHGYAHVDVPTYQRDGTIMPREFFMMDKAQTQSTLHTLKQWLTQTFSKDHSGFVAPAWGYREGVTKPVAQTMFSYIADSNQHLQEANQPDYFGSVESDSVSMFESWRSGMSGINMANEEIFSAYLNAGVPVHLMLHGALAEDPLTHARKFILLLLIGLILAAVNLSLVYNCDTRLVTIAIVVQGLLAWSAYVNRQYVGFRLRLTLSRIVGSGALRHLAHRAFLAGGEWMFVEELAEHMREYNKVSLTSVFTSGNQTTVILDSKQPFSHLLSVHFPFEITSATLVPEVTQLIVERNVVRLRLVETGTYKLSVNR